MDLKDQIKFIYDKSRSTCLSTIQHYGGTKDTLEIRHWEKLDRILDAQTKEEAEALAKRAEESVFMTALALTATRKISGPNTHNVWLKKAKKAESLVKCFEKKATSKFFTPEEQAKYRAKAEKQRIRAEKLNDYATRLAKDPNLPPPSLEEEEPEPTPTATPKPKRRQKVVGIPARKRRAV